MENVLAAFGYNRDGKKGKKQIVIGLLCTADGDPVAVRVLRQVMLDIVIDTINSRTGGGTKYINQRDEDFLLAFLLFLLLYRIYLLLKQRAS